jgi:hypothetical protein
MTIDSAKEVSESAHFDLLSEIADSERKSPGNRVSTQRLSTRELTSAPCSSRWNAVRA